jgi:predicted DNA-binding WGR domain protein
MFGLFRRQPVHEYLRKGDRFWHLHLEGDALEVVWGEIDGACLVRVYDREANPKLETMTRQLSRYMRREDGYRRVEAMDTSRCEIYPYERFYAKNGTYFRHTAEPRFWEIDLQGLTIVVRAGELGTRGAVRHLTGSKSKREAEARVYRMVSDKKAEGFSRSMDAWVPTISLCEEAEARERIAVNESARDDPGPLEGWPPCLARLRPPKRPRHPDVPAFLEQPYLRRGVAPTSIPLVLTGVLGHCPAAEYPECKNLPDRYRTAHAEPEQQIAGDYHWFDFQTTGAAGDTLPLRLVLNTGSAGCWGEVWDRESCVRIADILSTGDLATTVQETGAAAAYQPPDDWIPPSLDNPGGRHPHNHRCVSGVRYAHGTRCERLVHAALITAHLYILDDREFLELLGYPTA